MNENLFVSLIRPDADLTAPFLFTSDGREITYGGAMERSGRLANVLVDLGVRPGDRIAVQVDKSPDALMLYLAALRVAAIFLPLNTAYTDSELEYFLKDAEPALVVCAQGSLQAISRIACDCEVGAVETLGANGEGSLMEAAKVADPAFETRHRSKDDIAALLYTSGTTGRSKGAMLSHDNLASNARALLSCWHWSNADILLHILPIFHTHGLFVATNLTMMAGASMIFLPKFDVSAIIENLPRSTVMMGVPTSYSRLLGDDRFTREIAAHMRLFISGSAPLSPEHHKEFEERTGHAILERYGMTETSMNTSNPYEGERRAGTVGFPLPDIEIRIADPRSGRVLQNGEVGGIEIRGPNVFKGYWRMADKTREEFRDDGFFISGDLGFVDELGYLSIVGRNKDLVISGGFNVYPAEIEAALDAIDGISESAVIGLPHADFSEGVTAIVAVANGVALSEEDVRRSVSTCLAAYKVPKRVLFVKALPRNVMGKVQKKNLRETYHDIYVGQE